MFIIHICSILATQIALIWCSRWIFCVLAMKEGSITGESVCSSIAVNLSTIDSFIVLCVSVRQNILMRWYWRWEWWDELSCTACNYLVFECIYNFLVFFIFDIIIILITVVSCKWCTKLRRRRWWWWYMNCREICKINISFVCAWLS